MFHGVRGITPAGQASARMPRQLCRPEMIPALGMKLYFCGASMSIANFAKGRMITCMVSMFWTHLRRSLGWCSESSRCCSRCSLPDAVGSGKLRHSNEPYHAIMLDPVYGGWPAYEPCAGRSPHWRDCKLRMPRTGLVLVAEMLSMEVHGTARNSVIQHLRALNVVLQSWHKHVRWLLHLRRLPACPLPSQPLHGYGGLYGAGSS